MRAGPHECPTDDTRLSLWPFPLLGSCRSDCSWIGCVMVSWCLLTASVSVPYSVQRTLIIEIRCLITACLRVVVVLHLLQSQQDLTADHLRKARRRAALQPGQHGRYAGY